jgi:hypothetical protein
LQVKTSKACFYNAFIKKANLLLAFALFGFCKKVQLFTKDVFS